MSPTTSTQGYEPISSDPPQFSDSDVDNEIARGRHLLRASEDTRRDRPCEPMTTSVDPEDSKRSSGRWPIGNKRRTILSAIGALGIIIAVPSIIAASHNNSGSSHPQPSPPADSARELQVCFVGGNGVRVDPDWLSKGHSSKYMMQGPSGSKADNSWCTDLDLDALERGGPDQTLKIDVVSETDGITTFTLFPHQYDLPSRVNHFRSLLFMINPGEGKVTLHSKFSDDIKELPWSTELECGIVCADPDHPNGQRVRIPWGGQVSDQRSEYQCRDKPATATPCSSDDHYDEDEVKSGGRREGSDREQPVENSFSRAPS